MINSIAARDDFEHAAMLFAESFGFSSPAEAIKQFKLTQSALRLEQPLLANTNQYRFPILNTEPSPGGQIFNTELRLRQQDTFVPTHVGLFLAAPASTSDATFRLYSYPNQFVFANALQMRALYNGEMKIMVNNYQYTYSWDLQRHWKSNQTQQTAAFGAASPEDQDDFSCDGFFPMQPYVLFGGAQNVQITINLPAAPTAVDANSRYVMIFRGVLAQNSTPVS